MAETIDPGTGLPVGLQPTPVGVYDFSQGFQAIQDMLDKIGKSQANRIIQREKDKKEFEELYLNKPTVWKQDDDYVQEALNAYDKIINDAATTYGYDQDKWPDKEPNNVKKQIREAEAELNRRAAEAKANEKWYTENLEKVKIDDGKLYDTGWGNRVLDGFMNADTETRNQIRLSTEGDTNPIQRSYTIDDVVEKYKVFDTDEKGETKVSVEKINKKIYEGIQSGIGERMYELNRLDENETKEQFAKRVAEMSPDMLREVDARLRKQKAEKEDYGFNVQGFKWDPARLTNDVNAAENVSVNTLYAVRKGMSDLSVTVGSGPLQFTYKISHITRTNDGKGGYDYWMHGERNGVPLSVPQKMDQQDIGAVNAKTQEDLIDTFERKERQQAKQKWKTNEASNYPQALEEPSRQQVMAGAGMME